MTTENQEIATDADESQPLRQAGLDAEKEMAKKLGWNRLGSFPVTVNRPLTDQERIDNGEVIANNQVKVRDMARELKAYND